MGQTEISATRDDVEIALLSALAAQLRAQLPWLHEDIQALELEAARRSADPALDEVLVDLGGEG